MTYPVPAPAAPVSLTDIVTVMGASARVTLTDVADTVNEVRTGRMPSARAGPASRTSAAAANRPAGAGRRMRAKVGLSAGQPGMRGYLPRHGAVSRRRLASMTRGPGTGLKSG